MERDFTMDSKQVKELIELVDCIQKEMVKIPFNRNLTKGEFFMLHAISCALEGQNKASVSKIRHHLNISKPAISKMISVLEEKGYVMRIYDSNDHRVVFIELTELGRQVLTEQNTYLQRFVNQFTEQLGKKDTDKLLELLKRIYEVIHLMGNRKE